MALCSDVYRYFANDQVKVDPLDPARETSVTDMRMNTYKNDVKIIAKK